MDRKERRIYVDMIEEIKIAAQFLLIALSLVAIVEIIAG